jgi:glutamine synthetase
MPGLGEVGVSGVREVGVDRLDIEERDRRARQATAALTDLRAHGVTATAATWVDTSGITRVKAVPLDRLPHAAAWGIGASPVFDAFLVDDSIASGRFAGGPVGDLRLHPDLDRLAVLDALPGWAWVPVDRFDQEGNVHPQDARHALRRAVARLAEDGWSLRAAFEIEWAVSAGEGEEFVPASSAPAYGMARISDLSAYVRHILQALDRTGVEVVQIHPEYSAGQYELSVAPDDPLGAADTAVLVRETIRAVTVSHGLRATFAPKIVPDGVGNGGHVHLSLWRGGANAMNGPTPEGEAFAAGILHRLPALLAVGCPSVASYLRLVPSHWSGAYACWGTENREAALRYVTGAVGERDQAANLEVKCFDAAANPYLALAALLAAGAAGLGEKAVLPEPVETDPAALDQETLDERGIRRLPSSLDEAVEAFEAETVLTEALGEQTADTIATVRRAEAALFAGATPAEITAATRWRY